jgi:amino acid permease
VLAQAFLAITFTYVFFGIFGYLAYGNETKDIITLNLPKNWSAAAVKVGYKFRITRKLRACAQTDSLILKKDLVVIKLSLINLNCFINCQWCIVTLNVA